MCAVQSLEAFGKIGLQVLDVLQADVHAQKMLAGRPRYSGPIVIRMGGDHQAFVATPARSHAEDIHAVQHGRQCIAAISVAQGEGEQA